MVHWPKTVGGNVLGLLLALADAPSFADVLPHWNDHSDRVPNASGS